MGRIVHLARLSDVALAPVEALGLAAERDRVVRGATGRVLEIGTGTGHNLAHYRGSVTEVVVSEPSAGRRDELRRRAAAAPVPVTIEAAGLLDLTYEDGSFDTLVSVLALCVVPDLAAAVTELHRLVAADGQLLFVEPVLARTPIASLQRLAGRSGLHLDRDVIAALRAGGFVVTDCERPQPFGRVSAQTVVRGRAVPRRRT